jgi:ABC-type polysaccharide/polyol phosphate export permease
MEIFEFVVGCIEALAAWRLTLMIGLGIALGVLSLIWVRPEPLNFIVGAVSFVGSLVYGIYWQRSAERCAR